jgi:opacity protein-like surface antigen
MKKITALASAFLLATILSGTANALPGITFDVGAALPTPSGSFSDAAKAGFGVSADVFVGIPMIPLKVGGHAAYNRFNAKGPGSETFSITEILPSVRYSLISLGVADIFAQIGVGYYNFSSSVSGSKTQKKLGFNIGPGVSVMFTPAMRLFVMPLYNLIKTENENTSYLSINLGLRF